MKATFKVDGSTTASQHAALAQFFTALALSAGAHVVSEPEFEEDAPLINADADPVAPVEAPAAGTEAPKRRRRTKAELEAETEAVAAACATAAVTNAESHTKGNVQPAATQTAPVTATTEAPAASVTPATASPSEPAPDSYETAAPAGASKAYTEAEIQDLAGRVARAVGPEVVKAEITALGAARIADLSPEQRNTLGAVLTTKLP